MSHVIKSVGKVVKKIAPVALPIAASFIPGIGPLGMALAGGLGGAVGGGGLKGALLGAAASGIGGGLFGSAPGVSGISGLDSLNSSIFNTLSPIGSSISNFISSPLQSLGFGSSSGSSSPLGSLMGNSSGGASSSGGGTFANMASKAGFGSDSGLKFSSALNELDPSVAAATQAGSGSKSILASIIDKIKDDPLHALATGATIMNTLNTQSPAESIADQQKAQAAKTAQDNSKFIASLNSGPLQRNLSNAPQDYYHYGERANNPLFFDNPNPQMTFAQGGMVNSPLACSKGYARGGMSLKGKTGGQDDKIHARLSDGEYVIPADVVASLGDGNTGAGGKALDAMLKNVRKQKAPAMKKGALPPKAKSPLAYVGA